MCVHLKQAVRGQRVHRSSKGSFPDRPAPGFRMDNDVSDGTSSASEGGIELDVTKVTTCSEIVPPTKAKIRNEPKKKRKTTYYMRRDEIAILRDELKALKAKIKVYETRPPPPPPPAPAPSRSLSDALAANAFLGHSVSHNTLMTAGTQSVATAYNLAMLQDCDVVPLRSYIHLPADPVQRNAVLSSIHASKLATAARFMGERTRHLDLRVDHRQVDQFELAGGDAVATTLSVTNFTGGHSLRQVSDALTHFLVRVESCVFEQLGVLTMRESDELENHRFGQTRLLSSLPCGLEIECNMVTFAEFVDATETTPAYAVGALDFVDQDDLYPYRPDVCLRKEFTGATILQEMPSATGGKPTVAMTRWSYVRIPASPISRSPEAESVIANGMLQWCDLVTKAMLAQLAQVPPAA